MEETVKFLMGLDLTSGIIAIGLMMSRIMGMMWLAPFLGGKLVPSQVKIGIGFALAIIIYPVVMSEESLAPIFKPTAVSYPLAFRIFALVIKEVLIGTILGFVIMTIWHITEMAGRFIDTARGSAMGTALVPQMQASSSQLASLYYQMLVVIFLAAGGHLIFIKFFCYSYVQIPISSFPRIDTGLWPFFELLIRITADLFKSALTLSGPVMIAIFITDACMGLFNKVAPQINIMFLMMPFKAMLGVLFSMFALYLFIQKGEHIMEMTLGHMQTMIQQLAPF